MHFAPATIKLLSGAANGVNLIFTTPTRYVAGSLRAIINGFVYEPTDAAWGWAENSDTQITFTTAPPNGATVQAFYNELESVGSPYGPDE